MLKGDSLWNICRDFLCGIRRAVAVPTFVVEAFRLAKKFDSKAIKSLDRRKKHAGWLLPVAVLTIICLFTINTYIANATNQIDVPFIHQMCDTPNDFNGCWACGGTSAVMILAKYGKLSPQPFQPTYCSNTPVSNWGYYVNNIYTYGVYTFNTMTYAPKPGYCRAYSLDQNTGTPAYGAYGYIHYNDSNNDGVNDQTGLADPWRAVTYFQEHGLTSDYIQNPTEAQVQAEINAGYPVWMRTRLWSGGHIVVIKGYTTIGTSNSVSGSSCTSSASSACSASNVCYIVNDPWPCGHSGNERTGEGYLYTWSQMQTGVINPVFVTARGNSEPSASITAKSESSSTITLGQSFTVSVTGTNNGGAAGWGGLSVSFPQMISTGSCPGSSYNGSEATVSGTATALSIGFYNTGCTINGSVGQMSAQYLLAEGSKSSWASNESQSMTLTVTPKTTGTFTVYVRMALCQASNCSSISRDPTSGTSTDQQGYAVYSYSVTANPSETVSSPTFIQGQTSGYTGTSYTYSTGGSASSLGHSVQYQFDWGDGTNSGWLPVGTTSVSKSWPSAGTYYVKTQSRCSTDTFVVSSWSSTFTVSISTPPAFNYSLSNSGPITVTQGLSGSNTITATLVSGTTQSVSFSASGLPSGATASFSPSSCNPTCSTILTISTNASTVAGTYTITVLGMPLSNTTTFSLIVNGTGCTNHAPTISVNNPPTTATVGTQVSASFTTSDADGNSVTVLSNYGTVSGYMWSWRPSAAGTYTITLTANDGQICNNTTISSWQITVSTGPTISFNLPDTGQTKCYDTAGTEIACAGTGQDGAYNINPMSYTDNGNGTITDNVTGLIWQKGENPTTYNWYQASGTYDATNNPSSQSICGSLSLGGQSGWRLPTEKELMSIVDYSIPSPGPTINTTYFPNTYANGYWSSTTARSITGYAWHVYFNNGSVYIGYGAKSVSYYVRCVHGGQSSPSFTDNGNGTVTDNGTGLMWQQGEPGIKTWADALTYCEGLSLGGQSDWRLPNIKELDSITDDSSYNPAIDTTYFPNAHPNGYWSSTTDAYFTGSAWYVDSYGGGADGYGKSGLHYVRCVRGGQSGSSTFTVTTTATNGTITSPVNPTVNSGATTTVTGSANANYYFTGVSGCGGVAQNNTNQSITTFTYTTGAITSNCTVAATFSPSSCTYSISPTSQTFTSTGGTGTVTVTASASSCTWTATSPLSWATVSPASGTGSGTVTISVSANTTGASRTGTITIAGQTFAISQSAASTTPAAAILVSPSGTITTNTPTYTWNAVSNATSYYLNITNVAATWYTASQAGCGSGTGTCSITTSTITGSALAADTYTWYVQTSNSYGDGPWSSGMTFTVLTTDVPPAATTLVSPSGTIFGNMPTYTWNAVSNATSYYLNITNVAATWYTASQAGCGSGTGTCSITGSALADGSYTWYVQTRNSYGDGPWSRGMTFTVSTGTGSVPAAATLVSPSGTITTNTPTYTWNAVSNATSYYLNITNVAATWYTASQAGCGSGTGTCSITGSALADGSYTWYVQTRNSYGDGPWSRGMTFTVSTGTGSACINLGPQYPKIYGCTTSDINSCTPQVIPPHGTANYCFTIDKPTVSNVIITMNSADWTTSSHEFISNIANPTLSEVKTILASGSQTHRTGSPPWYNLGAGSNEMVALSQTAKQGDKYYVTVYNTDSVDSMIILYWKAQ